MRIRYRRNPLPNRNALFGRKVLDAITGFWTYEGRTVRSQQGHRVDGRGSGYDQPDNVTDAKRQKR